MRYHELITETEESSFILNPACKPEDYQITDSFRDIKKWRVKCWYSAEYTDGRTFKRGDWDGTGYVMISKVDNTIIPIARVDEHHTGFDMLYERYKKVNSSQYCSIWCLGNNYVYDQRDIENYKIVLPKYIAYGGNPNGMLIGTNDLRGIKITIGDFLEGHPFAKNDGKGIGRIGTKIYEAFVEISKALSDARSNSENPRFLNVAKKSAEKLVKMLEGMGDVSMGIPFASYEKWMKEIRNCGSEQELAEIVFGFSGVKNVIHNELRKIAANTNDWNYDNAVAVWGNLDLAIDMLGRL